MLKVVEAESSVIYGVDWFFLLVKELWVLERLMVWEQISRASAYHDATNFAV